MTGFCVDVFCTGGSVALSDFPFLSFTITVFVVVSDSTSLSNNSPSFLNGRYVVPLYDILKGTLSPFDRGNFHLFLPLGFH